MGRKEEDMALALFLFALSSQFCLFDITLTPTIYAIEAHNVCDHREIKCGFLLTLALTISLSGYFFFLIMKKALRDKADGETSIRRG